MRMTPTIYLLINVETNMSTTNQETNNHNPSETGREQHMKRLQNHPSPAPREANEQVTNGIRLHHHFLSDRLNDHVRRNVASPVSWSPQSNDLSRTRNLPRIISEDEMNRKSYSAANFPPKEWTSMLTDRENNESFFCTQTVVLTIFSKNFFEELRYSFFLPKYLLF